MHLLAPTLAVGYASAALLPQLIGDLCHRDNPCIAEAECKIDPSAPIVGRPYCVCPAGYEGDGRVDGEGCYDIDECLTDLHDCDGAAEICVNTLGSFQCECRHGYQKTSPTARCTDIDECVVGRMCPESDAVCFNTPGSFACICVETNHEYIPGEGCVLKDMCTADNGAHNPCDPLNGVCVSTVEGVECFCESGFRLEDNGRTCTDLDECMSGNHRCPPEAYCRNVPGGYTCECDQSAGWRNVGDYSCAPLNECTDFPNVCSDPAFPCCIDLPPPQKYTCVSAVDKIVASEGAYVSPYGISVGPAMAPVFSPSAFLQPRRIPTSPQHLYVVPSYPQQMSQGSLMRGFAADDIDMMSPSVTDESGIDSVSQWYANSRSFLDRGIPSMSVKPVRAEDMMGSQLLQRWTPPALQPMASQMLREWTPPGLQMAARKAYQAEGVLADRTVEAASVFGQRWMPPLVLEGVSQLAEAIARRKLQDINEEYMRANPAARRRLADFEALQEDLVKRFTEAAIDVAPKLMPPIVSQRVDQQLGVLPSIASATCPANAINSFAIRQQRNRERIPEAASHAFAFFKRAIASIPDSKLDPNAVAVGVASNVQNLANQLSDWYQAFIALPNALEGAASNVTGVNVVNDLENLLTTGVKSVQPIYDVMSRIVDARGPQGPQGQVVNAARDAMAMATSGALPRGSGLISAPIANL